eukprot:TRINITY_DN135635_c0_g1_i1.p1 TRINITY_DN135635_c0_g1~~TRINITY_DN135635_c0_g1_i1.p1  ORF type:complete len:683 (+),score=164.06 TRINITY_DN135635_c0_g1_i1:10225-12273(+)
MKENTIPTEHSDSSLTNGVLKNITNKIINKALCSEQKKPNSSDFTFSKSIENLESDPKDSNFTFCEAERTPPVPAKPMRILDLLPSKIQEKYSGLKQHVLGRVLYRFCFTNSVRDYMQRWKQTSTKIVNAEKAEAAADTVERISKVSRSFISLNALGSLVNKKETLKLSKYMYKWRVVKEEALPCEGNKEVGMFRICALFNKKLLGNLLSFHNATEKAWEDKKQREISDLKGIVKQYGYWEQKINEIEDKLKSENEELLNKAKYLQCENCKLQEALAGKNKDLVEKINVIESLSAKLKEKQKAPLEPVSEAICARCKESLEESRNFGDKGISGLLAEEKVKDLIAEVERLQQKLKEKVESENMVKKELEEQVDLVLKMEEERLILLKESKICKEKLEAYNKAQAEKIDAAIETEPAQTVLSEKAKEAISKVPPTTSGKATKTVKKTTKTKGFASSKKKLVFEKPTDMSMASSTITTEKESLMGSAIIPQVDTKDALTQEIIKCNRENTKLKKDLRAKEDMLKKVEKELADLKKQLAIKVDAVEKLRRENGEMAVTLQTDQFKSIRLLETEKSQCLAKLTDMQKKLAITNQAKTELEQDLENDKKKLQTMKKSIEGLEKKVTEYKEKAERYNDLAKEVVDKRETIKRMEGEKASESTTKEQLLKEKAELEKKVIAFSGQQLID